MSYASYTTAVRLMSTHQDRRFVTAFRALHSSLKAAGVPENEIDRMLVSLDAVWEDLSDVRARTRRFDPRTHHPRGRR